MLILLQEISFEFHGTLVIRADERCSRAEEGGARANLQRRRARLEWGKVQKVVQSSGEEEEGGPDRGGGGGVDDRFGISDEEKYYKL